MSSAEVSNADPRRIAADLEALCVKIGPRPGGSREEARARTWLLGRFRGMGLARAHVEKFSFDDSAFSEHSGRWMAGRRSGKLGVRPLTYSPSTPPRGIEGDLVFLGAAAKRHKQDERLKGKVGLFLGAPMPDPRFLRSLCRCGIAAALIVDNRTWSDWPTSLGFPEAWGPMVEVPMFSLPYTQAWALAQKPSVRVRLRAECSRFRSNSGNVIAELPGETEEAIVLCGHVDSVVGSPGANDDASGVVLMLEAARVLRGQRLRRTIRFVGMGMEERLSVGAYNHVRNGGAENVRFVANFDSCGSLLGATTVHVTGPAALAAHVRRVAAQSDFADEVKRTVSPFTDNFAFNMQGIPSVWLYRSSNTSGNWFFHSSHDRPANASPQAVARGADFAVRLVQDLARTRTWPFPASMPRTILKEIGRLADRMYSPLAE